jgi:hypothetical protein
LSDIDETATKAGPQEVPVLYLKFLDAALTRGDFRQALYDVYQKTSADGAWQKMVANLVSAGICDANDTALQTKLLTQIVKVNWAEVYNMEQNLDRHADTFTADDGLFHIESA